MSNKNTQKIHRVPLYRRPVVVISLLVLLAAAIALTIWAFASFSGGEDQPSQGSSSSDPLNPSQPSQDDHKTDADSSSEEPERPPQYEGGDPNELSGLTGSITLNTHDSEKLIVAVNIDQYLSDQGLCKLSLLQNGRVLRGAELSAIADVTTSGCGPFSIPITGLSPGTYQLEITISGDGKSGLITGEVQI